MSQSVAVEFFGPSGRWLRAGPLVTPDGRPGSLSSDEADGHREVYLFGWVFDPDGPAALWRSRGGIDLEDPLVRIVMTAGDLLMLAELDGAETPELEIRRAGVPLRVRFRLVDDELDEEPPP